MHATQAGGGIRDHIRSRRKGKVRARPESVSTKVWYQLHEIATARTIPSDLRFEQVVVVVGQYSYVEFTRLDTIGTKVLFVVPIIPSTAYIYIYIYTHMYVCVHVH